jgi:23S rRNA pseudouridine2605 synthase
LLYDIHGKTSSGRSSEFSLFRAGPFLNQQQLQIARTALWHQNAAPVETYDAAASWLDETGLCLFLPRHAQFPAPAPSLVEACMGAASAMPPPAAIAKAMELATRLVEAGQAIPLNLLGSFSEQPDALVTPDVLPWVAAIRGDRQWKTAPGGRTSPIVLRTWEALEKHGAQTTAELREALGREVTDAAVLRALIELWTTLRAMPVYAAGEATRWELLKARYAAQLSTAANTAQATALSALISLYLRSAVAATGEEAEIFLSPLTARSRIRDVLHGMTAARQLGTMSVASQTLLFVEGSLPEVAPVEEPEPVPVAPQTAQRREARGAGRPERQDRARRERPPEHFERDDRGRKAARPGREFRPAARDARGPGQPMEKRPEKRPEGRPWQKRQGAGFQQREGRPPFRKPFGKREDRAGESQERPPFRKPLRAGGKGQGEREERPRFGKGPPFRKPFGKREGRAGESQQSPPFRKPFRDGEKRQGEREERPRFGKGPRPPFRKPFVKREGRAGESQQRPPFRKPLRAGEKRQGEREERPRFGKGPRPQFGKRFEGQPARREQGREGRPPRPGKKFAGPSRFERGERRDRPRGREFRKGLSSRGPKSGGRPERGGRPGPANRGAFRPGKRGRGSFGASPRPASGKPRPRQNGKDKPRQEEGSE